MSIPLTESTDMRFWSESGWTFKPFNIPTMAITLPVANIDLIEAEPQDLEPGVYELDTLQRHTIDPLTHQNFLEESLEQYGDIWKILAVR